MRRVVVTGRGVVTPLGNDVETFFKAISEGKSGITSVSRFDTQGFSSKIAGEVRNFNPEGILTDKDIKRFPLYLQYAVVAAKQAFDESGIEVTEENAWRIGVDIGSGVGGIDLSEKASLTLDSKGPRRVSPLTVPFIIIDMASGVVSIYIGAKGPNYASVSACASSTHSIINSTRLIQLGDADVMVAGGTEAAVSPLALASFCSARALSSNNDNPEQASRPFDRDRDGFVMSEGSAVLILEELEHAKARGATILGEIIGCGMTGDAYHITAPDPEGCGAMMAMKLAIKQAGISIDNIDCINAHGTSTKLNDMIETKAIKKVFTDNRAYDLFVHSVKSMTGHLLGASGALEIVASLGTFEYGVIPPTINLDHPDKDCDLNYVPNTAIERKVSTIMSNSFGFGGHNAVVILTKFVE